MGTCPQKAPRPQATPLRGLEEVRIPKSSTMGCVGIAVRFQTECAKASTLAQHKPPAPMSGSTTVGYWVRVCVDSASWPQLQARAHVCKSPVFRFGRSPNARTYERRSQAYLDPQLLEKPYQTFGRFNVSFYLCQGTPKNETSDHQIPLSQEMRPLRGQRYTW